MMGPGRATGLTHLTGSLPSSGSTAPMSQPGQVEDTVVHWPPANSDSTLQTREAFVDIGFLLPPALCLAQEALILSTPCGPPSLSRHKLRPGSALRT